MPALADALREPIALDPNPIPRFYRGGLMLGRFRGDPEPADGDRPEDWVGSATRTWTRPGGPRATLGLSSVTVGARTATLDELLEEEPEAMAGPALVEHAGPTLGVLVKLLDAGERLPVHCHPSRVMAASLLGSRFGKTEAWIVLGTRDGGPASVWAGFRDAVQPERLRDWIERQDTGAMLDALAEHRVHPGEVLLVPAGTPHAIGAGVFILELQEPTDFSVVAELRGFPIDPADATLGLGWDQAIGFFDTDAVVDPYQVPEAAGDGVIRLLGPAADPYFRALRHEPRGEEALPFEPAYAVGIVESGTGAIRGPSTSLQLAPGVTFALPAAAVPEARISGDELRVIWCLGPDSAALDRSPLPTVAH